MALPSSVFLGSLLLAHKGLPASTISPDDCNPASDIHTIKDSFSHNFFFCFPLLTACNEVAIGAASPHQYSSPDLQRHKELSNLHHYCNCIGLIIPKRFFLLSTKICVRYLWSDTAPFLTNQYHHHLTIRHTDDYQTKNNCAFMVDIPPLAAENKWKSCQSRSFEANTWQKVGVVCR